MREAESRGMQNGRMRLITGQPSGEWHTQILPGTAFPVTDRFRVSREQSTASSE